MQTLSRRTRGNAPEEVSSRLQQPVRKVEDQEENDPSMVLSLSIHSTEKANKPHEYRKHCCTEPLSDVEIMTE